MPYDGFIFTEDAPKEIKRKRKEEYLKRFEKKPAPSYSIRPQPKPYYFTREPQQMRYSQQPEYGYERPKEPQQKPIQIGKEITGAIKAVHKYSQSRRRAKLNEVKILKKDINQRLEVLRAQNEIARLKKAQHVLKTAKQREAIAKAKQKIKQAGQKISDVVHEAKIKMGGSIYGK